jgi:hypothetical protein
MEKDALEKSIESLEWWGTIGGLLVVIGVALESWIGVKLIYKNHKLSEINQQERVAMIAKIDEARLETEKIRKENLEMEASLAPRTFYDQYAAGDRLKAYAPVKAVIQTLNDRECINTAAQIFATLRDFAQWNVKQEIARPENEWAFQDGITVNCGREGEASSDSYRASDAASELVDELNKTKMKATHMPRIKNFAADVVVIQVGMRPNPALERTRGAEPDLAEMKKAVELHEYQQREERAERRKNKSW